MSEPSPLPSTAGAVPKRSNKHIALLLIVAGAAISLLNSGPVGAVIWSVVFPLALLTVGVDLITQGRERRRIAVAALIAAAALAPLIGAAQLVEPQRPEKVASLRRQNQIGSITNAELVQAQVQLTAGHLRIEALDDESDALVAVGSDGKVIHSLSHERQTAMVDIEHPFNVGELDLRVTRRLPVELSIKMGSGNLAPIDLEDILLAKLAIEQTTGNLDLKLPNDGIIDVTLANEFGDVEVEVPEELAARIEVNAKFGDVDVDDRFELKDGAYVSDNYREDAPNRATIRINKTAGNVEIR
ncbi:MAG: cell wall-active antibiotics response protein [Chloroflexota bacterium]|nr:cell wall-active antibiotics response protein [Chloroflexota bacterium]